MEKLMLLVAFWTDHGTKVLGTVGLMLSGLLVIPDLFPPDTMKYWLAANVVIDALTVQRGFTNSKAAR